MVKFTILGKYKWLWYISFRLKARKEKNMDRLRYDLNRIDELKLSIRKKLNNVKEMHGEVFALEPKLRDSYTNQQAGSAKVAELAAKVKEKEEEIKYVFFLVRNYAK